MSTVLDQIIYQLGMVQVGPSISTFWNQSSNLILSILDAKTDNFYYIGNLPLTPNYYDSYLKEHNSLKNDYFKFLHSNYLACLDFDRILLFNIWENSSYAFLYPTLDFNFLFFSKISNNVIIKFPVLEEIQSNINWFLNYEYIQNSNFLENLRLFSNSIYWVNNYGTLNRNFYPQGFYLNFLYNRWDFEIVVHSIFSLWYQTHGDLFEDDLVLELSGLLNYNRNCILTDINYFSSGWAYSRDLVEGYYINRYGQPIDFTEVTEYGIFQQHNNYIIHDFLSKKTSIEEYLEGTLQFQPPKKINKDQDVTDFTEYMKELNLRKQGQNY